MKEELTIIHNYLMGISVSGDDAIRLAESLVRIRKVIDECENETVEKKC